MTPEVKQVLRHAHDEVVMLRRRIADLEPQAEAYRLLQATITRLKPEPCRGESIDVAWRIKTLLDETADDTVGAE